MWQTELKTFGVVHIIALVVGLSMIYVGAVLGKKYKYSVYGKKIVTVLGITGLVLLGLEAFKQIFMSITEGWDFKYIPYQICSMDLYVLLIIPFIKNEKIRKYFVGFVAYVSLAAAVFYFFKPAAALKAKYVVMTLHSCIWHWILIGIGSFSMVSFELHRKEEWKSMIGTLVVFVILTLIAVGLNELMFALGKDVEYFYINSHKETFYPLLNLIFKPNPTPYVVYVISFIIYFSIGSGVFYLFAILIRDLSIKIKAKKEAK